MPKGEVKTVVKVKGPKGGSIELVSVKGGTPSKPKTTKK